ncbi:phage tail protein [Flavobacteriaceae bacterium]|nr:phage tail protein [Flavobacteriaceae bacterium]
MKPYKLYRLIALCYLAFQANLQGQANVTSTGISVQGIARDENNSALANEDQLGLNFKLYYLDSSNSQQTILNKTGNVRTDAFGVFAFVIEISESAYIKIANTEAYLTVSQGDVVFSNEKLQAVPYAIFAQNGAPTGSITSFVGTTIPEGWLLCDGSAIPNNAYHQRLRDLVGANTPDLQGVFLRGTGTYDENHSGPSLGQFQSDEFQEHQHDVGTLTVSSAGRHIHPFRADGVSPNGDNTVLDGQSAVGTLYDDEGMYEFTDESWRPIDYAGTHTHPITGNTGIRGGDEYETRPVNYGINWIIKI